MQGNVFKCVSNTKTAVTAAAAKLSTLSTKVLLILNGGVGTSLLLPEIYYQLLILADFQEWVVGTSRARFTTAVSS